MLRLVLKTLAIFVVCYIKISNSEVLDLESILKQITPDPSENIDVLPSGEFARFRRSRILSADEEKNLLSDSIYKKTEKRQSEDDKKFSIVKLPDSADSARDDEKTKLHTGHPVETFADAEQLATRKVNSSAGKSRSDIVMFTAKPIDKEIVKINESSTNLQSIKLAKEIDTKNKSKSSRRNYVPTDESGSGSGSSDISESGSGEEKRSTISHNGDNELTLNEAAFLSSLDEGESGSGSGAEAEESGSGTNENANKRSTLIQKVNTTNVSNATNIASVSNNDNLLRNASSTNANNTTNEAPVSDISPVRNASVLYDINTINKEFALNGNNTSYSDASVVNNTSMLNNISTPDNGTVVADVPNSYSNTLTNPIAKDITGINNITSVTEIANNTAILPLNTTASNAVLPLNTTASNAVLPLNTTASNAVLPLNTTAFNGNSIANANQTIAANTNNGTAHPAKKYTLTQTPEEIQLSNEASKLFNFETSNSPDEASDLLPSDSKIKTSNDTDDDLPGSQGGALNEEDLKDLKKDNVPSGSSADEDLMSDTSSSNEKKSAVDKNQWKIVLNNTNQDLPGSFGEEGSGSGSDAGKEVAMSIESTIGKTYDASLKKSSIDGASELLPGDYGDETPLTDLESGSGSGSSLDTESGDSVESGSGSGSSESAIQQLLHASVGTTIENNEHAPQSFTKNVSLDHPVKVENFYNASGSDDNSGDGAASDESGSGSAAEDIDVGADEGNRVTAVSPKVPERPMSAIDALSNINLPTSVDGEMFMPKRFHANMTEPSRFQTNITPVDGENDADAPSYVAAEDATDTDNSDGSGAAESGAESGSDESGSATDENTQTQEPTPEAAPKQSQEEHNKEEASSSNESQESASVRDNTDGQTTPITENSEGASNIDTEEATINNVKTENKEEEENKEQTHKKHHHHHHHHHHHNKYTESEPEEETCIDRENCPQPPAHSKYTDGSVMPQQGDIVTEQFLEHLMVSQLLEQNLNLFYTNMAGRPGEQGEEGEKGAAGGPGMAGMNGYPGAPGDPGAIGPAGAGGVAGPIGPPGLPGLKGNMGDPGEEGLGGPPGSPGPPGPPGSQGYAGEAETFPNCSYVCEGEKAWLQCHQYEVIKILRVFWGREDDQLADKKPSICPNAPQGLKLDKPCESNTKNAFNKVDEQCKLQSGCEIVASNIFFDDNTCGDTFKYLKVCYECMPDEANAVDVLREKKRRKKRKIEKRGSERTLISGKRSVWEDDFENNMIWKHPVHQSRHN